MRILWSLLLSIWLATPAWAAAPSRTYTYVVGNTVDPNQVTTNEDNIYAYLQAGVDTYAASSITAAAIADNAVGSSEIATDAVDAAEIAAGAVGASELASTAVTAGSYTLTSLTVDADGRLTSASSGTAAGGTNASRVQRTAGDVTTTSATLADITGLSITITTAANPVQLCFSGSVVSTVSTDDVSFNMTSDGSTIKGTTGITLGSLGDRENASFCMQSAALTAASHTFTAQIARTAGTGTVTLDCDSGLPCDFSVTELVD